MIFLQDLATLCNIIPLSFIYNGQMPYIQSNQYTRNYQKYVEQTEAIPDVEAKLLQYILQNTPKGDPLAILQATHHFCAQHWMMNVGQEKGAILVDQLTKIKPKTILELGGYCGHSALLMAAHSEAVVHSIEPNQYRASIAHKIHQHAGLEGRIVIHLGTLQSLKEIIHLHGKYDFVFIDHMKHLYLSDLKELEELGTIRQGTVVFADNIIRPGCPDYLQHMQNSDQYSSTLFHSYLEYSNIPDAVLVSLRIAP